MKKSKKLPKTLVPHPRYGSAVRESGHHIDPEELGKGYWRYGSEQIFPESAVPANIDKQNWATFPRQYYVDMLKQCRTCQRPFLFFAEEQRYWYETLRFFIDADCVLCPECRVSDHELKRRVKRYEERITSLDLSERELETQLKDAAFLVDAGYFKHMGKVGALKNRAKKLLPESAGLAALIKALADKVTG